MPEVHEASLKTRMLQGFALAAFVTVCRLLVYGLAKEMSPLPQLALLFGSVAAGGAVGGATYYATDTLRVAGGWRKTSANVLSLLAYCFATLIALGLVFWLTTGSIFGDQ